MKLPRRQFLQLAAGAAALPAVSRLAKAQAYTRTSILSFARASAIALITVAASGAVAQDFGTGLSAYKLHQYDAALASWWPLAAKGHADSQAALGYMYLKGFGVAQDNAMAAQFYAQAAAQGQVDAQYFLGTLFLYGRGVEQDYAHAHVLCELAMTRGVPQALWCRDEAIAHLDAEQLDKDYRRIAELYEKYESQ